MLDKAHDSIWRSVSYLSVPLLRCDQSVWSHVNYTLFPLCSFISAQSSQATRRTSQRAGSCSGTWSAECLDHVCDAIVCNWQVCDCFWRAVCLVRVVCCLLCVFVHCVCVSPRQLKSDQLRLDSTPRTSQRAGYC